MESLPLNKRVRRLRSQLVQVFGSASVGVLVPIYRPVRCGSVQLCILLNYDNQYKDISSPPCLSLCVSLPISPSLLSSFFSLRNFCREFKICVEIITVLHIFNLQTIGKFQSQDLMFLWGFVYKSNSTFNLTIFFNVGLI